ncbi:MAG: flippase-like domain-containing protein [Pirellulales bacterium]|nr:flippase-like domain-containing protein [Pirellulales bacterium]
MSPLPAGSKKWLLRGAKMLVVLLVAWGVHRTVMSALEQLSEHTWHVSPGWLVLSGVLYLLGSLPCGLYWRRILLELGQRPALGRLLRAYYIGHLGKYVPGKAMVLVLRASLLRGPTVDGRVAAVCVVYETMTMMAVGAALTALALLMWTPRHDWLILLSAGFTIVTAVPCFPPVFERIARFAGVGRDDIRVADGLRKLHVRRLLLPWLAMAGGWLLLALSLWGVLAAIGAPGLDPWRQLPLYTAAVGMAVVVGFLSLVPGGALVREAVLLELVAPLFGASTALVAAILLRLVWLVSEVIVSGILYLWRPPQSAAMGEPEH